MSSDRRVVASISMVALSLGFVAGCGEVTQDNAGQDTQDFEQAVTDLKASQPADYESALLRLQDAHGIKRFGDFDVTGVQPDKAARSAEGDVVRTVSALSSGTQVYSTTYNVRRTEFQTMRLTAGQKLDWYTTQVTASADPVMALLAYEATNSNCTISSGAMPKLTIKAYNDDFSGNQSRFQYTVPTTGCYALLIYAYSTSSSGTVRLHKDGCDAPPPPTCSGQNPTICTQFPATCYQTSPDFGPTVLATGTAIRSTPNMDFMATSNASSGADTWIFALNFSNMTGASNDDTSGLNSAIDRTDFRFLGTLPNTVVLTGFNSVGTATFKGYRR